MFNHLQIYDSRERLAVGCLDVLLKGWGALSRLAPRRPPGPPRRILMLRLERIGDLLMALEAVAQVRLRAPAAELHLVVGSWNASLARIIPGVDSIETLDVPWLARNGHGDSPQALLRRALSWRAQHFDLGLNFEPDIRSNLLLASSGASRRVGFLSGGGGALLTTALSYAPTEHTAQNALRVVDAAIPAHAGSAGPRPGHIRLPVPDAARREAHRLLGGAHTACLIGIHASGGRPIKQWPIDRFASVAAQLARDHSATIVLTGGPDDRPLVDRLAAALPSEVPRLDVAGPLDLSIFAAVIAQLRLFVTCDTGPMHLAAAVGTPVVALFGPSDPGRWGPLTDRARIVTTDLWCRPCNRVRRPPVRCAGRVPDCMNQIDAASVCRAASELFSEAGVPRP